MFDYGNTQPPAEPSTAPTSATFSYDNSPGQSTPAQTGPSSLLGDATGSTPAPTTTQKAQPGGEGDGDPGGPAVIQFAPDGAGDPPSSYDGHLGSFFDGRESDAIQLNQHEHLEQLRTARGQIKQVLSEYQVGNHAATELFASAREYIDNPRTVEVMTQEREATMKAMTRKWGSDTPKMIKAAQEVFNDLCRKVPGLAYTMIETGAANDLKFIVHLANIGKRTGSKSLIRL